MKNKVVKIDGAPGITLEGKQGNKGKKGGMTFFTNSNSIDYFSIFDMWSAESIESSPIYVQKYNFCEYAIPDKDDYIVTYSQNIAYIYIVELYIPEQDLHSREDIQKYADAGQLSLEYVDILYNYYQQQVHHTYDCYFVKKISVLNTALSNTNNNTLLNIDVRLNSDNIMYDAYTGNVRSEVDPEISSKNLQCLTFTITAEDKDVLTDIKIEAEFYKNGMTGEMHSIMPQMWSTSYTGILNSNYPIGYIENYNYNLNYDDEILDNFTVTLINWDDIFNENVITPKIKIPENMISAYSVNLYAYCITPSGIDKIFIGNFEISSLLDK